MGISSPHSYPLSIAAAKLDGSCPMSSNFFVRCLKNSWVLSRLNVTQGLKASMSENPLCWMPPLISSTRCFTWRRNLSRRKAVNLIVHNDVRHIDVAPHGVNEVIAADTVAVAVPAGGDNFKFVVGELGACGHGEGAPMKGVHSIAINETGDIGGTADTADHHHLVRLESQLH